MRKKIVAGNWKMNLSLVEAVELYQGITELTVAPQVEVVVFPPALFIDRLMTQFLHQIKVGVQNAHPVASGAFTGEISMQQAADMGIDAVLIGHSERRQYFNETNDFLRQKTDAALANKLRPFFCCGEPLKVRESNDHLSYVKNQLHESLFHLSAEDFQKTVIAYEPIWAIGTGLTASTEQAEEMHAAIRDSISGVYGETIAENYSILYGGSCNPSNASALFACPNVDGGLIGGAALKLSDFEILVAEKTWITSK
ncbi:MAG: triose-phosphate isomerase [Bacteroidota bacterium]